jgi:hypothetical protein
MNGWADLGQILSGSVKRQAEQEYLPQLQKNFSAFKALEEAKRERSINQSRERLLTTGKDSGASPFALDVMLSNDTVDFRNAGDAGNPHYFDAQKAAFQAAQGGKIDNPMLTFLQGKPVSLSDEQNGVIINPLVEPNQQQALVTPIGDSIIAENLAQANSSNASAGKYNTETKILGYDLGAVSRGEPVPSKRTDKGGDTDTIKADEAAATKSARAALNKALLITDPVKRKATQKAIYNRLIESGYGKIANELMGE